MSIPHCLVHNPRIRSGSWSSRVLHRARKLCLVTENDTTFNLKAKADIPIGHKVALADIKKGDTIWKYGEDIGRAIANIKKGDHLHVHNVKTKRW